jgi:hypothetical protein
MEDIQNAFDFETYRREKALRNVYVAFYNAGLVLFQPWKLNFFYSGIFTIPENHEVYFYLDFSQ